MSEGLTVRRLAAILAADAVGYSRLMRENETRTRDALNVILDELFRPVIAAHGGRIVKIMGDGLLAEFQSVVGAAKCAVALQAGLAERNAGEPSDTRMDFRIGVNLGDVIVEGDDIHGDGVNVAARLESLAEPGSICVSESVFEQVHRSLPVRFEDMGPQRVKNISDPIRAYRLAEGGPAAASVRRGRTRWKRASISAAAVALILAAVAGGTFLGWPWQPEMARASVEEMAFPLPDKPSIAVMPLANVSGDPEQAYFVDGLTEDIITSLAGFPNLFVIARNSTLKYRDEGVDIRHVAEDLGVQYVLEGSVRRSADDLRISVRLIDALQGSSIWAQTYDRKVADVFAVQDEITGEVASRLSSNIVAAEFERRSAEGTRDVEAYDLFLRGWHAVQILHPKSNAAGIELFQQALDRDPKYARALAGLATLRAQNVRFGWGSEQEDTYENALQLAWRAVEQDQDDEFIHRSLGNVLRLMTRHEEAIAAYQKALVRSPSNPNVLISLALTQAFAGQGQAAVNSASLAFRLNPFAGPAYHQFRGTALYVNG